VDGRHKAGHDDQGIGRFMASDPAAILVGYRTDHPNIVRAGLVPAIHGFLCMGRASIALPVSFPSAWRAS
jgi:hypothetical protein